MKEPALNLASLLRVSTTGQSEDGYGLDDQERGCRALYARTGHRCVETLIDDGISGTIRNRPAVMRALELLRTGAIQGIVTPAVDRLGRGAYVIHDILHEIRSAGGVVLYANMDLPEGPAGRLLEGVSISIAEYEHAMIRKRTMEGRRSKAGEGRYPAGIALYGYRVVTVAQAQALPQYAGRDGELVIEEREAEIIRELFARYEAGASKRELAKWLNTFTAGLKGGRWEATTVDHILRRRAYMGELLYGRRQWQQVAERRDPTGKLLPYDGRKRSRAQAATPQVIPCPAIITPELFERVQERLAANAPQESLLGRPSVNVLRGCVACAYCRRQDGVTPRLLTIIRENTNSKRPGYQRVRLSCASCHLSVPADRLERKALVILRENVQEAAVRRRVAERLGRANAQARDLPERLARVQRELSQCDQDEGRIADMIEAGLSAPVVKARVQRIHERREAALLELHRLESLAGERESEEAVVAEALERARELQARLREAETDRELLQRLFQRHVRVTAYRQGRSVVEIVAI